MAICLCRFPSQKAMADAIAELVARRRIYRLSPKIFPLGIGPIGEYGLATEIFARLQRLAENP
jgi:hypothetical protein